MTDHVLEARYVRGYVVWLRFEDGAEGEIDLEPVLCGEQHEPLKDQAFFRQFTLHPDLLNVVWPNSANFAPRYLRDNLAPAPRPTNSATRFTNARPAAWRNRQTYVDLVDLPDDLLRHELIDGEHIPTSSPWTAHQEVCGNLVLALGTHLKAAGGGEVLFNMDVVLSAHDVVVPDVFVILAQQDIVAEHCIRGAPAIVIEVPSPTTRRRDAGAKRQLYGRSGVREYWLVDPDSRRVTVCRLDRRELRTATELSAAGDDTLTSPLLPLFELRLHALFADAENREPLRPVSPLE